MMKHASKLQEFETNIETEFYREIADEMLEGAYFDFKSLNRAISRQNPGSVR